MHRTRADLGLQAPDRSSQEPQLRQAPRAQLGILPSSRDTVPAGSRGGRGAKGEEGSGNPRREQEETFENEKDLTRRDPRGEPLLSRGVCVWRVEDLGEPRG